jgi:hypothetical protein
MRKLPPRLSKLISLASLSLIATAAQFQSDPCRGKIFALPLQKVSPCSFFPAHWKFQWYMPLSEKSGARYGFKFTSPANTTLQRLEQKFIT